MPRINRMATYERALEKIASEPEGVYSRDREVYLDNVIKWIMNYAREVLDGHHDEKQDEKAPIDSCSAS